MPDGYNNIGFSYPINNFGAIDMKMDGSDLEEKSSFTMLGLNLISAFMLSPLVKLSQENWSFDSFYKMFLSPEVSLYLCKSTLSPCMK